MIVSCTEHNYTRVPRCLVQEKMAMILLMIALKAVRDYQREQYDNK